MSKESFSLFRGQLMGAKKYIALKALSLAEKAHEGVMRKDKVTPYIEHPAKVASMLFELGIQDDNILATALLHDVLEDCKDGEITKQVFNDFPKEVSDAVFCLSKNNYRGNEEYYEAIQESPIATIVKLADRAHNLSTVDSFTDDKKKKYVAETIKYVYPLIKYAQHNYYELSCQIRMFDLWIEGLVKILAGPCNYNDELESINILRKKDPNLWWVKTDNNVKDYSDDITGSDWDELTEQEFDVLHRVLTKEYV